MSANQEGESSGVNSEKREEQPTEEKLVDFIRRVAGDDADYIDLAGCKALKRVRMKDVIGGTHSKHDLKSYVKEELKPVMDRFYVEELKPEADKGKGEEEVLPRIEQLSISPVFGEEKVDMTVDGVLEFLRNLQATEGKVELPGYIHSLEQRELQLIGREVTVERVVNAFKKRHKAFTSVSSGLDRTEYPIVVFSGMPGLGKTRMLEEWPILFEKADIPKPHMGLLVSYGNGHSPLDHENTMPIEPAFCWRMLLQVFVRRNIKPGISWNNPRILPSNANDLTLSLTMKILRDVSRAEQSQPLSLFIGVDEYQKIPNGPDYSPKAKDQKAEREKTNLWKLMNLFLDQCMTNNVHLYPAFAGTKWGPLNIGNSSTVYTKRVPLYLLSPQMMEEVVRTSSHGENLTSLQFRRELFFLGGIPRPSVEYMLGEGFVEVWNEHVDNGIGNVLSSKLLFLLVAKAVRGDTIDLTSFFEGNTEYTWNRLIDEGVCMQLDDGRVGIPYCLFRLAASKHVNQDRSFTDPERCLCQNLLYLQKHVDDVLYDLETWKAWEVFGACFFAMRVNSFLLLGHKTIKFHELFPGAVVNGCEQSVKLAPMKVFKCWEQLSADLPRTVHDHDTNQSINWVHGNDGIHPCVINGDGGQGVDFFAAFELDDGNGLLHYNDQRKVVASPTGRKSVSDLLKKARITPKCLPDDSVTVCGLFSSLTSYRGNAQDLPPNSCVVTNVQHKQFHGTLSLHPACKIFVEVNKDNISTLRLLTSLKDFAESIDTQRKKQNFKSVDDFASFCQENEHTISENDKLRVIAEG